MTTYNEANKCYSNITVPAIHTIHARCSSFQQQLIKEDAILFCSPENWVNSLKIYVIFFAMKIVYQVLFY